MYKLGRLIPITKDIEGIPKTRWYHILMRRAKLHSIINDIDDVIRKGIKAELDYMFTEFSPIWSDEKAERNTDFTYTTLTTTIRHYKCAIA